MSTATQTGKHTPGELLTLPDAQRFELVDGELVERNMGFNAVLCGGQLYALLTTYVRTNPVAVVAPADASYQCFEGDPEKVRRPDVSCILIGRLPPSQERVGHCRVAPDGVAEVVSPRDAYYDIEVKVHEYLGAGVRLVWVVNPPTRSVRVHRLDGTMADLGENDELSGEDVLPGFHCRVGDLFLLPTGEPIE
ncbi:MAG: Uma2 family endonuclease [Planctomycetaceae bacterium]